MSELIRTLSLSKRPMQPPMREPEGFPMTRLPEGHRQAAAQVDMRRPIGIEEGFYPEAQYPTQNFMDQVAPPSMVNQDLTKDLGLQPQTNPFSGEVSYHAKPQPKPLPYVGQYNGRG